MRISDWSSDVCSSDLLAGDQVAVLAAHHVVGAQHFAQDEIVAGQRDGGPGLVVAAHHRGDVVRGGIGTDRQRVAGDGVAAEAGHDGVVAGQGDAHARRSEEHTSELQSLMRISYAVFCLKKKKKTTLKN